MEAEDFLKKVGARYSTTSKPICAICVEEEGVIHGVAVMGRVSKGICDITHIYSDGSPQVFTTLYGQCVRTLKALGYSMMSLDKI